MRRIQKGSEPKTLTAHRKTAHADYDNYTDKDTLRQCLVDEQKGVCCYCMSRIRPPSNKMKIEHWQCQKNYQARQLDYTNLLGACPGGEGKKSSDQTCDTYKGDLPLSFNPSDPACNVERLIKFPGNGRIKSDDPDIDRQLNDVLNLNHPQLVKNRKSILESFCQTLTGGRVANHVLQRMLRDWRGDNGGELHPYSQVVVYYLCRKLGIAL